MSGRQVNLAAALVFGALLAGPVPFAAGPARAEEGPMLLKVGSQVCGTRTSYRAGREGGWKGQRFSLAKFRAHQQEQDACLYIDDDALEDMMAPFVTVMAREGDLAKVTFVVEFYKRIEFLHRRFSRVQFTGWTEQANLEPYVP